MLRQPFLSTAKKNGKMAEKSYISSMKKCSYIVIISSILLLILFISSCGIENFESQTELNPPLGLVAVSSNKQIHVTFTAYNNEKYFAGYNVLIAKSEPEDIRTPGKHSILKNESTDLFPFYAASAVDAPREISFSISKNTNGGPFVLEDDIYIAIAAYDALNKTNSKPSNVELVKIAE